MRMTQATNSDALPQDRASRSAEYSSGEQSSHTNSSFPAVDLMRFWGPAKARHDCTVRANREASSTQEHPWRYLSTSAGTCTCWMKKLLVPYARLLVDSGTMACNFGSCRNFIRAVASNCTQSSCLPPWGLGVSTAHFSEEASSATLSSTALE